MADPVQNYGANAYSPPTVMAMPSRNWVAGTLTLSGAGETTLFRFDTILCYRGATPLLGGETPVSPGAGLILTVHCNVDSSGVTWNVQEDIGDNVYRNLMPAAQTWPPGLNQFKIRTTAFVVRGRVTRISGSNTICVFQASITGY